MRARSRRRHRRPLCRLALALLVLAAVFWPGAARAWWNGDWSYRVKITLDTGPNGAAVTEPIGRTPVLIRLHAGNFNFADAREDGSDLRFVAGDDKTPLKYSIEKFDGLIEQVGLIWVDVPDLAPGAATPIWMYFGNPKAPAAADPAGTYDAAQTLVYHFADADGVPRDQTANGNTALSPAGRDEAGLIGQGALFDAGGAPVRLPASPSLTFAAGQPLTWSAWVRIPGASTGVLFSAGSAAGGLLIGFDRGMAFAEVVGAGGRVRTSPGPELSPNRWYHLAVTVSDRLVVRIDGAPYGEAAASLPAISGEASLGGPAAGAAPAAPSAAPSAAHGSVPAAPGSGMMPGDLRGNGFMGQVDELEIASTVRPAGYLEVAARSQGLDAKLVAFDVAETSGGGSGYLQILLKSLTFDGWVVIVLCTVMAIVCAFIMVGKTVFISRLASANKVFREEFEKAMQATGLHAGAAAATDLSEERLPILGRSTLYGLYHTGLKEVAQRVGDAAGGRRTLGVESVTAIRAALDSELLRQTQRMNSQMVMLTIAISGGPFLGLLGTVVGVMITFAAVAAAGDVNINAIAPGIAAALLATVAGLGVAIPALFGYNYLLTRIKEQSSQMQLFVNELTARIAETYAAGSAGTGH